MAKKKDSEKHEDGQRGGKYNKDDADANELENFVDDITDEELLGDVLQRKPKVSDGVDTVIIVDGVPQVNPERFDKLKVVITKIFAQFGKILNDYYPKNENGHTKGYIFIEYEKHESALEAVTQANNYKLDKQHTFLINLFSDYKKYNDIPEKWEAPTLQPFPERPNLQYYLSEPDAFDQYYVYNINSHIEVWLNSNPQPTKLVEREKWTESLIMWSPLGTYLATLHKQGVVLWGGPNFTNVLKLSHRNVQFVDFSPCEQYLVAYAPLDNGEQKLTIFDIRTGAEKRSFISDAPMAGNVLRWSKDDKYFARIGHNTLSVYETPSFGLLDKKSITVNGIRDFSWSPRDNVLAYWVAEDKDVPARVVLLEIPSRKEIRANNLFNVADCKIHWQKAGDYLCVKVDRYAKIKREKGDVKYSGMYFNFEIFHMREKNIPVDSVEIKEPIHAFVWEPIGSKFAIIHGEPSNNSVSFYNVKSGQAPVLLKKLDKHFCSHLFWSPAGQYIVIAEIRDSGALEFVDTADFTTMCSTEHYKATDIEWDPTGRFVATGVSSWKTKGDTGYWIWSFQGRILNRFNTNTYCHMQWRPRPPTLLSAKQQKDTKKSLKKYTSGFETKDKMRMTKASKEVIDKRRKLFKEFEEYRSKRLEDWNKQKAERMAIRNHIDTDALDSDDKNVQVEKVEFLVKEEVTVID